MTSSGKIQKVKLRERARSESPQATDRPKGRRHDHEVRQPVRWPRRPGQRRVRRHRGERSPLLRRASGHGVPQGRGHRAADGPHRLRHLLDRRAPLPARGLRVHPERAHATRCTCATSRAVKHRLRLQHRADVASPPAGGGLRDGRRPHQRPGHFGVGRGYHTREVESFGAPLLDQTANRELFEEQVDIIFKSFNEASFSHQGKHYTMPPHVPYRGYDLQRADARAAAEFAGPSSAGSRFRAQPARARLHGHARHQGHHRRRLRRRAGPCTRSSCAWRDAHARPGQHLELGERPLLRLSLPHRRQRRAGHHGGDASSSRRT